MYARILTVLAFSPEWLADADTVEERLTELDRLLQASRALPDVPLLAFLELLAELESLLLDSPAYDSLSATMADIAQERSGDEARGRLLLRRGLHLLGGEEYVRGLRVLGQARGLLMHDENIDEALHASVAIAHAYESLGLYWAARMESLLVISRSLRDMSHLHDHAEEAIFALVHLSDSELLLGRLRPLVAWQRVFAIVFNAVLATHDDLPGLEHWQVMQDGVLSVFAMNLPDEVIGEMAEWSTALEEAGFNFSKWVVWYRSGRADDVLQQFEIAS